MKTITIVEVNNVMDYPPIISLVKNLLNNGNRVKLIAYNANELMDEIHDKKNFSYYSLKHTEEGDAGKNILKHIIKRITLSNEVRTEVKKAMLDSDILWTTSNNTVRVLGKDILKYKNVMQLMELMQYGYFYKKILKYNIEDLARKSWKVVVPEENRAYIQRAWWNLKELPYILPNKPYSIDDYEISDDMYGALERIRNEKRRIVMYLGGIWPDRDLSKFADAIKKCGDDYCLYVIGKASDAEQRRKLEKMIENRNVEYLGFFKPPKHLEFLKYAYIGLLPYKPSSAGVYSELNALYCAPNKIYEYAAYGVPMIGSDVLGLKKPFEKFGIGKICDIDNVESISRTIKSIEADHASMSKKCSKFYNDIDLDEIVYNIISDGK